MPFDRFGRFVGLKNLLSDAKGPFPEENPCMSSWRLKKQRLERVQIQGQQFLQVNFPRCPKKKTPGPLCFSQTA